MQNSYDEKQLATTNSNDQNATIEAGRFRTILPQVLAAIVKNFLLLDLGLSIAIPTIIIPALTGLNPEANPNEQIHVTAVQASWLASLAYIFQPLGSVVSGWITEPIGRKKAMFFVNVPHLVAWTMLYYSTTLTEVFFASILLGLGVGLMEAPIITYVGEICQPSIRGTLIAMSGIAATLGLFLVFLLGSITEWRNVALYCLAVPVLTMIAVCFIPETPLWLLSKNRTEDAQKSLQWLRGWVSPKAIEKEFAEIKRYSEFSKACASCVKSNAKCPHPPPTTAQKLKELTRKRTLKPFALMTIFYFLAHFSGSHAMRPYIVLVLKAYGTPISANYATVAMGLTGILGTTTCVLTVKLFGKRKLFMTSMFCICVLSAALSVYGFLKLPAGWTSFSSQTNADVVIEGSYVPMTIFILLYFFSATGVGPVPSMLLGELFPFKSRGIATGITGGVSFFFLFCGSKSYYNLESWLSLPGVAAFYATVNFIGLFIVYYLMPETERRTLEDIELHFSDNTRGLTDRKIPKNVHRQSLQAVSISERDKVRLETITEKTPSVVVGMILSDPANTETGKNTGIYNKSFSGDS